MTNRVYSTKDEKEFDEMVQILKDISESEKEKLNHVFKGIIIGVSINNGNYKNKKQPVV